ncbi:MAG: hypothetical protein PF448_08200 [Bacteroidales bacterium]|nr:hypothetical protein [Bacteroidales bacterium]
MGKRNKIISFWLILSVAALVILGLQFLSSYLIQSALPEWRHVFGHVFVFSLTGLGFMVFVKLRKKHLSLSGLIFGGISMLKMLLAAIYLLPILLKSESRDVFFVLQFLIIYMIYLAIEVRSLLILLKDDPDV